jgi:hypothetical protein
MPGRGKYYFELMDSFTFTVFFTPVSIREVQGIYHAARTAPPLIGIGTVDT